MRGTWKGREDKEKNNQGKNEEKGRAERKADSERIHPENNDREKEREGKERNNTLDGKRSNHISSFEG
jgi:hypothetical protein